MQCVILNSVNFVCDLYVTRSGESCLRAKYEYMNIKRLDSSGPSGLRLVIYSGSMIQISFLVVLVMS